MRSLDVIHARDGSIGLGVGGEAYETEAAATTGVAILDDDLRWLVRSHDTGGEHVQLPGPDRTPRTSGARWSPRCAMRGHCCRTLAGWRRQGVAQWRDECAPNEEFRHVDERPLQVETERM